MGNPMLPEGTVRTPSPPDAPLCYMCKYRRNIPGDAHSLCAGAIAVDQVTANAHGVRSGWFWWPFNFDPIWLESCGNYSPVATA